MKQLVYTAGDGVCKVEMTVSLTGAGVVAQLYGGERPHVGAVALSQPRPSRSGSGISCNTSVLPLLGHKDDEIAKPVAEELAKAFDQPVVVITGLHVDNADAKTIAALTENCRQVARLCVEQMELYQTL